MLPGEIQPMNTKKRILILGGGFGGLYTALELEKVLGRRGDIDVTLISSENFFLFTPMLHEVAASDLDITHIVSPLRKLLKRVRFFVGDVEAIDLEARKVSVSHGESHHHHELEYDHLVLALGAVTNFYGNKGLERTALTMKSLGDAIHLRNRLISKLEEADFECLSDRRNELLTFIVAGGGFAGVETIAGVNDFLRESLKFYPNLTENDLRVVLVHGGDVILPELSAKLGRYAEKKLESRGVEIHVDKLVTKVEGKTTTLSDGTRIEAGTIVWTAGTAAHPILSTLPCAKESGRVLADETMSVAGFDGLWALGDCAAVPDTASGGFHPPTAQHAIRQGKVLARNLVSAIDGRKARPFSFETIGQLAAIGRRTGVAQIMGVNFSGFVAWWLWRTIYLMKLPRLEKKLRVAIDWSLDLLFSKDLVEFLTTRSDFVSHESTVPGQNVEASVVPAP
ncbi:MAG: NAD(P)/FAD-dependent oxidoreductase [Acidobacteria bacterium]|nr:MAG: NAD(P)/FAD-dependent oxidoreductase [Acidobacteriota bacterium]REJ97957.1 MAG: NAD(P)/FAD-dependent oxidoreductase [Acidobacteriota bacterium]REK16700.1 MAG: NAD(P)/FAD-dependent oxidoreductase [Acidobacteriota bacterium]REK42611.1 MAG: NAD(P)/FAD-dependent oxidoreductase [Acidobacteriota bacterium]